MVIENSKIIEALLWVLSHDNATLTVGGGYMVATYSWGNASYTVNIVGTPDGISATATISWDSMDYYDQWTFVKAKRRWIYTGFRDSDPGLPWVNMTSTTPQSPPAQEGFGFMGAV